MARGEQLYDTCTPCHGSDGAGSQELGAPAIAGMSEWYLEEQLLNFQGSIRGAHADDVEGHRMRPMARSLYHEGDIQSVSQYVASLPKPALTPTLHGGDPDKGKEYYEVCGACHGADGSGIKDMHAPSLLATDDWYMIRQLVKYQEGTRGNHPDDVYGLQMQQMVTTLEDRQAMKDVLAYVRTLSQ
jgi:cytochrome c oxidase subunit 2